MCLSPVTLIFCFFLSPFGAYAAKNLPNLGSYNIDVGSVTVSGISSGGAMSMQYHFIYSSELVGAGIFAGGPYLCAHGLLSLECLKPPETQDVSLYIAAADKLSSVGRIDNTKYLNNSKVYIFHGIKDIVAVQQLGKNLKKMYDHYESSTFAEFGINAEHGQPVNDSFKYGGACGTINVDKHYINNCVYNGVYEMFKWFFGNNVVYPPANFVANGTLLHFNQAAFVSFLFRGVAGMSDEAMLYIPNGCKDNKIKCKLHIAFHGCSSNMEVFGEAYARETQYLEVAEVNNIIILFPQTMNTLVNPVGCWDWTGYTGQNYPTKQGLQVSAVNKMVNRVLGKKKSLILLK